MKELPNNRIVSFTPLFFALVIFINAGSLHAQDTSQIPKKPGLLSFQCDTTLLYETLEQAVSLPDARFYLINELHQVNVNPYLQFALIKYLNRTKALRYIVLEMPHSNAILYNLFLETADTAILRKAATDGRHAPVLFHKLYALNKTLPLGKKLKFIGVDVTMMNRWTFQQAIGQFWLTSKRNDRAEALTKIFETIKNTTDESLMIRLGKEAGDIITRDSALYTTIFQDKYEDLRIITSNNFRDKGRRDDEMIENLGNIISICRIDTSQVFFASFGGSHVRLDGRPGTFNTLLEQKLVSSKNKPVCLLGVQYLNCRALASFNVAIENDGIIPGFAKYKKEHAEYLATLKEMATGSKENITLIPLKRNPGLFDGNRNILLKKADLLILCRNFSPL